MRHLRGVLGLRLGEIVAIHPVTDTLHDADCPSRDGFYPENCECSHAPFRKPTNPPADDRLDDLTEAWIEAVDVVGNPEAKDALRSRIRELVEEARKEGMQIQSYVGFAAALRTDTE